MNRGTLSRAIRALLVLLLALSPPVALAKNGNPNPGVRPPDSRPYGASYAKWGARWWMWADAIPADINPIVQPDADCDVNQSGPVFFLSAVTGGVTRSCTIRVGKALFFPIVNINNDYPCPDPSFQPAPGQTLEEFLTEGAQFIIDFTTALEVILDGVPLQELFDYRATSRLFTFTGDSSLAAVFDPCITGTPQSGVADGYWIMLKPLTPGPHTLVIRATLDFGGGATFQIDTTYDLTVVQR